MALGRAAAAVVLAGMFLAGLGACGTPNPTPTPPPSPRDVFVVAPRPPGPPSPAWRAAAERYFPLVEGSLFHYDLDGGGNGGGVLLSRARRAGPDAGSLTTGRELREFAYVADGVQLVSGAAPVYVLRMPLEVGQGWYGERGGRVRIEKVGVTAQVPAGTFQGCVVTVEERGGDRPARYTTTFCPDVGIVSLEVARRGSEVRAELRHHGPPIDLGPDGVRVLKD